MKLRPSKEVGKSRFLKLFLPIFILVTLVLSAFGVIVYKPQESESFEYRGHLFIKDNLGFATKVNDKKIIFLYDPRELENLTIAPITLTQLSYATKFYISLNPNQDIGLALNEFNRLIIPSLANKRVVQACIGDVSGCEKFILKTCSDATPEEKIIIYNESSSPSLTYQYNCLSIQGSGEDMAKLTDKLALNFLL